MTPHFSPIKILIAIWLFCSPILSGNDKVWILANSKSKKSVEIAKYYADAREIPHSNIIQLPMPFRENIQFHEYINFIYNPLIRTLKEREAINVVFEDSKDEFGREKYFFISHRINFLVTCFGVPLKFGNTQILNLPTESDLPKPFRTARSAVDSDLSLIPAGQHRLEGPLSNPLFKQASPGITQRNSVIRVSRLDGMTPESAIALVDRALAAEKQGVWGRALIDIGGPHKQGDDWFEALKEQVRKDTWELSEKPGKKRFQIGDRTEDAAVYFGWYSSKSDGPFALSDYQFAPGAFGFHLHSASANPVRGTNAEKRWTSTLIERGITATVGNVFEPYLQFTHQPQLIYESLRRGNTWGEATYYALSGLSWQAVSFGDPLYRPFPNGLHAARNIPSDHIYRDILRLRKLENELGIEAAVQFGLEDEKRLSNPSFLIELVRLQSTIDPPAALQTLNKNGRAIQLAQENWPIPVVLEIAELLSEWGDSQTALNIFDILIENTEHPLTQKILKTRGRVIALKVADLDRAAQWSPESKD